MVKFLRLVGVTQGSNIIAEGIHPNVSYAVGIEWQRDTPREIRARDGEVIQACFEEVIDHLVGARGRLDKVFLFTEEILQTFLIF